MNLILARKKQCVFLTSNFQQTCFGTVYQSKLRAEVGRSGKLSHLNATTCPTSVLNT